MSLKDKFKKRAQTHERGYVSFTTDDLRQEAQKNYANANAYGLLDAAMTTGSHVTEVDKHNNIVDVDDVYPCTAAECDEMENLINQAEAAAVDKQDPVLKDRIEELRNIISWSRDKHWTFKWSLIAGCVLSIIIMMYISLDAKSDLQQMQAKYDRVDNWEKQDTTIAFDQCPAAYVHEKNLRSHNIYKAQTLSNIKIDVLREEQNISDYRAKLDTMQNRDRKKEYKSYLKKAEKRHEEYVDLYDEVNEMSFKKFKKYALSEGRRPRRGE